MLLTAAGLAATFAPTLHWKPWAVLAFIPSVLLAFALRFTVDWITATWAALNMSKVDAVNVLFFFILLMTSGQMAPLPLLPLLIGEQDEIAFAAVRRLSRCAIGERFTHLVAPH